METMPVLSMPRTPRIPRARCEGCHSKYLDVTWLNFMSDFLWKFNASIPRFAFDMYSDLKYGRALFRFERYWIDGAWSYDPDYGYNLTIDKLPPGELTIPSDALKINVDGTTYEKSWDGGELVPAVVADAIVVSESVEVEISDIVVWHTPVGNAAVIQKYGEHADGVSEAWDAYDVASVTGGEGETFGYSISWGTDQRVGIYYAGGQQLCFVFDTTNTPEAQTVTLRVRVNSFDNGFGTPTLDFYTLASALSTSDWANAGASIGTQAITSTGVKSITLTNADINYGGITRIKCTLTEMDGDRPSAVQAQSVAFRALISNTCSLLFTY